MHRVCSPEALDAELATVLGEMLGNGPTSLQEIKQLFGTITARPIDVDMVNLAVDTIAKVRSTDEAKEGLRGSLRSAPSARRAKRRETARAE